MNPPCTHPGAGDNDRIAAPLPSSVCRSTIGLGLAAACQRPANTSNAPLATTLPAVPTILGGGGGGGGGGGARDNKHVREKGEKSCEHEIIIKHSKRDKKRGPYKRRGFSVDNTTGTSWWAPSVAVRW